MIATTTVMLVAALSQEVRPDPDAAILVSLLGRPRLERCDELVCYHRPPQSFAVQDVDCRVEAQADSMICIYRRRPAPLLPVVVSVPGGPGTEAVPETLEGWSPAWTRLRWLSLPDVPEGGIWSVVADSAD